MTVGKMTPRERMLAAYEGRPVDAIPVAPEFWYYIPARVLDIPMYQLELEVPHWQALLETFRHYACEGWGIVAPDEPKGWVSRDVVVTRAAPGRFERREVVRSRGRSLVSRSVLDEHEPSWVVERPIKDFASDWPAYEAATLVPPEEMDWSPVQQALDAVGESYLLEVYVGLPFVDFAGGPREGGLEQVIIDLYDHPDAMRALQERYIDHVVRKIRAAFDKTSARSVLVASMWSTMSLLSPEIWRTWDKPVLEAAVEATHACGGLIHHHFHGRCMAVLSELADLGLDCVCPFERPPGGDVTDLSVVRAAVDDRTTFNGNVHTVEALIRGTPADVRAEVLEILQAFEGSRRLIVGTGDQVGEETADENIYMMIDTVRGYTD